MPIDFTITMDNDSSNEVYADIDTNLADGQALLIYGMRYVIETIDPTVPLVQTQGANNNSWCLQIHRNDDSLLLLNANDDDILLEHRVVVPMATAVGFNVHDGVWKVQHRTVTLSPKLRAIFRTTSDMNSVNGTTNQLAGRIFAQPVAAPSIGMTKLGQIADL